VIGPGGRSRLSVLAKATIVLPFGKLPKGTPVRMILPATPAFAPQLSVAQQASAPLKAPSRFTLATFHVQNVPGQDHSLSPAQLDAIRAAEVRGRDRGPP
jgi:hypothetical protein